MRLNLTLATRNLRRNLRRTLLSLAIIALGTAMIFAVRGYFDNSLVNIRAGQVQQFGNFQVASTLLFDNDAEGYEYLIPPDTVAQIDAILEKHPEVKDHSAEVSFTGLASFGRRSKVLFAVATEPGNQALDYNSQVIEGEGLAPDDFNAVLVGRSLAEERALEPGDTFAMNLSTVDGAYNVARLVVKGVFVLNQAQFEGQLIYLPLDYAQQVLNTEGVGRVIVSLENIDDTERVAAAVAADVAAAGIDLDVRTWRQLSQFYETLSLFFNAIFLFTTLAISVLVFFIVLQVLTMSFLERTREVGTVRALGTKARQVFGMFLSEALVLGVLGAALGVALGWLIALGVNAMEIGWRPPGAIDPVQVGITASLQVALLPFAISATATVLSALYPSARAARQSIVDALRTE